MGVCAEITHNAPDKITKNPGKNTSHPFWDENFGQVWKAEKKSKLTRS
jgi:hypothetical protein